MSGNSAPPSLFLLRFLAFCNSFFLHSFAVVDKTNDSVFRTRTSSSKDSLKVSIQYDHKSGINRPQHARLWVTSCKCVARWRCFNIFLFKICPKLYFLRSAQEHKYYDKIPTVSSQCNFIHMVTAMTTNRLQIVRF